MGSGGVEAFGMLTGSHHMCGKNNLKVESFGWLKVDFVQRAVLDFVMLFINALYIKVLI